MIDTKDHMDSLKDFILDGNQEVEDFSGAEGSLIVGPEDIDSFDFSSLKGNLKKKLGTLKKGLKNKKKIKLKAKQTAEPKSKIIIPQGRKVIIEKVNNFMLSNDHKDEAVKNIGKYKGETLKELILTFDNSTGVDFDIEIFNPSMPLDYLYSTSLNLNNKVQVGSGLVSYSDVLFNLLANPTLIVNAKFIFSGTGYKNQRNQPLIFSNRNIAGEEMVEPIQTGLFVDTMQYQSDVVFFNINDSLNRPYIPDGMDIIRYKVLAGMTVTLAFFYKQHHLKDLFFSDELKFKRVIK